MERVQALKGRLYRTARLYLAGDAAALDAVDEAVYKGRASEFEAPSEMLQQFFRAEVFPISEGLCGFTIHDAPERV